jgi:hypothetical protein
MPWLPIRMPSPCSFRTASSLRLPGASSRAASTKKSAVSSRRRSAGRPSSMSEALPSSKLSRIAGQVRTSSRTAWNSSSLIQ